MAARETSCRWTLITKTPANHDTLWLDGFWGASKRETRETRGRKRQKKINNACYVGWV